MTVYAVLTFSKKEKHLSLNCICDSREKAEAKVRLYSGHNGRRRVVVQAWYVQ